MTKKKRNWKSLKTRTTRNWTTTQNTTIQNTTTQNTTTPTPSPSRKIPDVCVSFFSFSSSCAQCG